MDDGEELELGDANGNDDADRRNIAEIKYTDLPFTSEPHQNMWSRKRYLGALIGKSAKAAQGAYEYTNGHEGGLGHVVKGLEGK